LLLQATMRGSIQPMKVEDSWLRARRRAKNQRKKLGYFQRMKLVKSQRMKQVMSQQMKRGYFRPMMPG